MPELPEVETIRRDLERAVIGEKIKTIKILNKKTIRGNSDIFVDILKDNSIKTIGRRGKLLIFELQKKEMFLLVHLKMTGQLIFVPNNKKGKVIAGGHSLNQAGEINEMKYCRVAIEFGNGAKLFFNDLRKFGYLELVNSERLNTIIAKYGIEPLLGNFKLKDLKDIIRSRKTNIKAVLLNQNLIAGIGNIYADEILFAARVFPGRIASSLTDDEIKRIHLNSKKIITQAIKERGTTFNNYVDGQGRKGSFVKLLKVYGRKGKRCPRCGGTIKKIKVAGRGTHYCECQK